MNPKQLDTTSPRWRLAATVFFPRGLAATVPAMIPTRTSPSRFTVPTESPNLLDVNAALDPSTDWPNRA